MEQTRTLEQLQLHMRQQLMEKQAQLLEELKTFDSPQKAASSRSELTPCGNAMPITASIVAASRQIDSSTPSSPPKLLSHHNGKQEGPTLSADESINGNTSQASSHASSHDTWDSSNAFAHERPVLTGSERSTPTATVPPTTNSNSDLELISQSVHIPYSEDNDVDDESAHHSDGLDGGGVNGVTTAPDTDLITFSSGPATADTVNAPSAKTQEDTDTPRSTATQNSVRWNKIYIMPV